MLTQSKKRKSSNFVVAMLFAGWYSLSLIENLVYRELRTVFPFPITITMIEFVTQLLINLVAIRYVGMASEIKPLGDKLKSIFSVVLCSAFGAVTSNVGRGVIPISLNHAIKATGTVSCEYERINTYSVFRKPVRLENGEWEGG